MESSIVVFSNKQSEQEIKKKNSMYSRIRKKKIPRDTKDEQELLTENYNILLKKIK